MTDLISRADAIEAVRKVVIDNDAVDALKTLPSADAPPYCVLEPRPPFRKPKTWHEKNSHTYICGDCGFEQAIYSNINEYNCCPTAAILQDP